MVGLLLTFAWAADADPCDASAPLAAAEGRVLELDFDAAHAALDAIEKGFACGATSADQIARFWLLTGALASFEGDSDGADQALIAARAADGSVWIDALGKDLRARYEAVFAPAGEAVVTLDPLPSGMEVRVDGAVNTGRVAVRPGMHVIQVRGGDQAWGRVFRANANEAVTLPTTLEERAVAVVVPDPVPDPVPVKPPRPPREDGLVAVHLGLGLAGAVGASQSPADLTEPSAKLGPTLEVGAVLRPGTAWVRAAIGGDLLLGGTFVFVDEEAGEAHGWPVAPILHAAGGVSLGSLDVGGMLGAQLPGRIPVRAVGSWAVLDRLRVEGRAGVNLGTPAPTGDDPTERALRIEPAFAVLATLSLP